MSHRRIARSDQNSFPATVLRCCCCTPQINYAVSVSARQEAKIGGRGERWQQSRRLGPVLLIPLERRRKQLSSPPHIPCKRKKEVCFLTFSLLFTQHTPHSSREDDNKGGKDFLLWFPPHSWQQGVKKGEGGLVKCKMEGQQWAGRSGEQGEKRHQYAILPQ